MGMSPKMAPGSFAQSPREAPLRRHQDQRLLHEHGLFTGSSPEQALELPAELGRAFIREQSKCECLGEALRRLALDRADHCEAELRSRGRLPPRFKGLSIWNTWR